MRIPATDLPTIIGNELNLQRKQVNATIKLLDKGATIPFIARYRKEATYGLDEVQVLAVANRLQSLREFLQRREYITEQIKSAGALTPQLAERIEQTLDPAVLEDIYLPFKPRRRTRAQAAREQGLEPLARMIMAQNCADPHAAAKKFVTNEVLDIDMAIAGACDIIAEWMSENEKARSMTRSRFQRSANLISTRKAKAEDPNRLYANYYDFSQPLRLIASHRFLAIMRGAEDGILKAEVEINDEEIVDRLSRYFVKPEANEACATLVRQALRDSYKRLLRPGLEAEALRAAKERADRSAIEMFAENLRQRLMSPPLFGKTIMGIDPGYKSGCKVACISAEGSLLAYDTVYPQMDPNGAAYIISAMVADFNIDVVAIGSGTAGRETENFVRSLHLPRKVVILLTNEDGASVYSASEIARQEFPDLDVTIRGAISIGRRTLDPLAELVKIEPQSIGVGQYQHDVDKNLLKQSLDYTVESCVNHVGVNVNTASAALLRYVSGIGPSLAEHIVEYRTQHGPFKSRQELMNVARMGEMTFQQCAGFLRIPDGVNPLDNTAIHPERYELVEQMARDINSTTAALAQKPQLIAKINIARYLEKETGEDTLNLIIDELRKRGRDPRGENDISNFQTGITSINDIRPGMELTGKVNNLTAFGAFVDLGIKENGLIHVSQLNDGYVASPAQVLHMDQIITARVLDVDPSRGRIALTLKGMKL